MKVEPLNSLYHGFRGKGRNIMTPEVLGLFCGHLCGGVVHIEVSCERADSSRWSRTVQRIPNGGVLVGISFRRPNGESLDPDPSHCLCDVRTDPLQAALKALETVAS